MNTSPKQLYSWFLFFFPPSFLQAIFRRLHTNKDTLLDVRRTHHNVWANPALMLGFPPFSLLGLYLGRQTGYGPLVHTEHSSPTTSQAHAFAIPSSSNHLSDSLKASFWILMVTIMYKLDIMLCWVKLEVFFNIIEQRSRWLFSCRPLTPSHIDFSKWCREILNKFAVNFFMWCRRNTEHFISDSMCRLQLLLVRTKWGAFCSKEFTLIDDKLPDLQC